MEQKTKLAHAHCPAGKWGMAKMEDQNVNW
jgi:hypothetical protein